MKVLYGEFIKYISACEEFVSHPLALLIDTMLIYVIDWCVCVCVFPLVDSFIHLFILHAFTAWEYWEDMETRQLELYWVTVRSLMRLEHKRE